MVSAAEMGLVEQCSRAPTSSAFLAVQPDGHRVACAVRLPSTTQRQGPDTGDENRKGSDCGL